LNPETRATPDFRAIRYDLQNVIRGRFLQDAGFTYAAPDWDLYNSLPRVVKCKRTRVSFTVDLRLDPGKGTAHYSGLQTCGSVWSCPVCAAAIQEVRRQEVAQAIEWAYASGYQVLMVTFTAPHYRGQGCADLLTRFSSALKRLRSGRSFQSLKESIGFQGLIRSLETLHGDNGWHNHTHELWIVNAGIDVDRLKQTILSRWETACDQECMIPRGKVRDFRAHAVDVRASVEASKPAVLEQLADYVTKQGDAKYLTWGADREMTAAMCKSSRRGSLHPFQLAARSAESDLKSWQLFCEYVAAFKGRAAVYWSPGLKARVGVNAELTDDEIAAQESERENMQDICSLDKHCWSEVLLQGARAELLKIAETAGAPGVDAWLARFGLHSVPSWIARFQFTEKEVRIVTLHEYSD